MTTFQHRFALVAAWLCGCGDRAPGPVENDVSDTVDVDPFDPIWDRPVEWEVQPSRPAPTDGEACGIEPDGSYLGPCHLQLADDWVSTLCDETRRRCVAPVADCKNGWCYVPPRSYLSGGGYDKWTNRDTTIAVVHHGFFVMQTEVTFANFERILGYLPDTDTRCGPNCPAGGVSAFEGMEFANRLSLMHGLEPCYELDGCGFVDQVHANGSVVVNWTCARAAFSDPTCNGYRFPSLREWELAVRAGSPFCLARGPFEDFGDRCELDAKHFAQRHVVFCGNADSRTEACPIGGLDEEGEPFCWGPRATRSTEPNDFGLHEAYGNQYKWLQSTGPDLPRGVTPLPPPPYPVSDTDAFWTLLDDSGAPEHSELYVGMGRYDLELYHQCGWITGLAGPADRASRKYQFTGLRLIRVAPQ